MLQNLTHLLVKVPALGLLRFFDACVATITENKMILSEQDVPFYNNLKNAHMVVKAEYLQNTLHGRQNVKDFFKGEDYLVEDENWSAIPLVIFNHLFVENTEKFPETFKLIRSLPGCCGAMFSMLDSGTHIPPHKGIYKGVYRCLFTLKVQENADCWIKIEGNQILFREGLPLFFDETFNHEVKNNSNEPRVVLFLDFYRKFPFPLNLFHKIIFSLLRVSPFVKAILSKYNRLQKVTIGEFVPSKEVLR